MHSDAQLSAIRARFPIFRDSVYLNSCSQAALSDTVEASAAELLRGWRQFGSPWDIWVGQYEIMRREIADFIGWRNGSRNPSRPGC